MEIRLYGTSTAPRRYAIIGLAVHAEYDGATFGEARLVFFNSGDKPTPVPRTATLLEGQSWSENLADRLAASLKEELDPPEDLNADSAMRKHLAGVLTKRVLQQIAGE